MSKSLLIKDVTTLAAFEPAIKLQAISADLGNHYFRDYILTQDLADIYERILASIVGDGWGSTASTLPAERRRSHLISAQYGTGKSYFLMILSALLDAAGDASRLQTAKKKFVSFREVQKLLGQLSDKKFLTIQISAEDKGDIRFKELLIHSLLQQVAKVMPDVVFSNEYTEAISHLEELEPSPIGPVFARVLDEQFEISLQQLRARLGSYDRDGLRIYYQACERALGRQVSRDMLDVETTFQEALDLLESNGYTHIAVLVDELTAYLNASSRHHSLAETLGELQAFAAYCNRPASRSLFVGAMHVSVREFLQDRSQQRDYEKMMGRFDEPAFPVYSSKLLAGIFQPDEDAFEQAMRSHRGRVKELSDLIDSFKMVDDGRPMKLSDFFPLHPAVAHYLPRVSRVLGQAERTSFGFIDDVVRLKLEEPLAIGQQLNLVTLDQVFDYFLPVMEQKDPYLQVITAHNTVQSRLQDPLAEKAFKPLVLLWVASRVVHGEEAQYLQTDLSAEQVAEFIGTEDDLEVQEALDSLSTTGFVYFDRSTQRYFYSHADLGWDLETEIQEEMAKVDANEVLLSELQALGLQVCLNVPDSITVTVDRNLESQWLDIRLLEETSSIKPKRAEGKVAFIVPDFADMERYSTIWSDVTQKARELSASNVAVAVPQKTDLLNQMELRRYRALQEIGKRLGGGGPGSVGEHRVRIIRARFSEVQARVRRDVETFGQTSNFVFFINHQPQKAQDLKTILTEMFERHYWKFPKVPAERINGRSTTNALIETCIVNPEYVFPSDTSEVARQARDTLQVLGLCSWEKSSGGKYEVKLKEPEAGSEGYEIWRIVLDTLTVDATRPFAALYKRLSEVPYGLPDYMVELYIAAARALKKVYILDKSGTMPPVGKKLVADITRRKDSDYRVLPVQETAVPYTYICSVWQAIDEPLGLRNYQDLEKSLGRTIDDQKIWFDLKADSNNLLLNRLGQVRENLRAVEVESRPFAILAKHLEQVRRIFVPAQGFEQLAALGEALSGRKVSDDPDTAALLVRRTIEDSENFLEDWQKLQSACRQYRQLRQVAELSRFGGLAQSAEESWQTYRSDALSAEKRIGFVAQFEILWSRYAEQYVDEHNAVAKARTSYGKEVENSLVYELVGEFSQFDFSGIATRATFDARIKKVRHQGCRPLAEDLVRDYQQFGRATCTCDYQLGSDTEILTQLQTSEASLATTVRNALESYLATLNDSLSSESTQVYTKEKATAEEKAVIASAHNLADQEHPLSESQYRTLKALLPKLRSILEQVERYVKEQARKRKELEEKLQEEERQRRIPRLPTAQLSDTVRTFLLDSGLEAMTLKELEDRLFLWLQEIAEEFKRRS